MANDFVIENGILVKYTGEGGDLLLPKGVTCIGIRAFSRCTNLTSVTIQEGVTDIEIGAFEDCRNLVSVEISKGVKSIGSLAFSGCECLKEVSIPDSVISIGDLAFALCSSLTTITIPKGVITIGGRAFWKCSNLTEVVIPESVKIIEKDAFRDCPNAEFVISEVSSNCPESFAIHDGILDKYAGLGGDVILPHGIIEIGARAFEGCSTLRSILIPDGVKIIGINAFNDCNHLKRVSIPDSVIKIEEFAFSGCCNLKSVLIPDNVKTIEDWAFSYCSSLTEVIIPAGVEGIGKDAFMGCTSLTTVSIANSVVSIGDLAFWQCSTLSHIDLSEGVVSIGERVFDSCSSLVRIILPDTLEHIGDGAFTGCDSLEEIVIPDNPKFGAGDWFKGEYEEESQIPQKLQMKLNLLEPFMNNDAFNRVFNKASVWNKLSYERQADAYLYRHIAKLKKKFKKFIKPKDSDAIAKEMLSKLKGKISAKERNAVRDFLIDYYPHISEQSFIGLYEKMDNSSRKAIIEALKSSNDLRFREILSELGDNSPQKDENKNIVIEGDAEKTLSEQYATDAKSGIKGMAFVVTGDMENFGLRDETEFFSHTDYSDLKAFIEVRGGFLRSSVSSKTNYLICNDQTEESVKLKKARELGINIITENEFLKMTGTDGEPIDTSDFLITKGRILKEYTGNSAELTIPPEVRIIGQNVFSCGIEGKHAGRSLEKVFIPKGVTEIKANAFRVCRNLKQVAFCEGLKIIGDSAFGACDNLTEIIIPSSVRVIDKGAFWSDGIYKVEIYDTLERIGRNSFSDLEPSADLELRIHCIAHNVEIQQQIILALGLDNVTYAFLHDKLTASEYIMDQVQKRLNAKKNRMYLMRIAIDLNDMPAIVKLLSLDIKRSKKENEEIIEYAKEKNNTEVIAYLLNDNHLKADNK